MSPFSCNVASSFSNNYYIISQSLWKYLTIKYYRASVDCDALFLMHLNNEPSCVRILQENWLKCCTGVHIWTSCFTCLYRAHCASRNFNWALQVLPSFSFFAGLGTITHVDLNNFNEEINQNYLKKICYVGTFPMVFDYYQKNVFWYVSISVKTI